MSFLTNWLLSVIATAFLVVLAEALMVDEKVRQVGRMVGGLLMLLALLTPVLDLRSKDWTVSVEDYFSEISAKKALYEAGQQEALGADITEACGAYIEAAAKELDLTAHAQVTVRENENGVPVPATVVLDIPYSAALSARIMADLDVAAENQFWYTEETG